MTYKGLERLGLELTIFDLEPNKELILDIMKNHAATLRHVSFSKNKVSNEMLRYLCESLAELNNIEQVDLMHLKDTKSVDWVGQLKSLALLSEKRKGRPLIVRLSEYQVYYKAQEIHKYLEADCPKLEISMDA